MTDARTASDALRRRAEELLDAIDRLSESQFPAAGTRRQVHTLIEGAVDRVREGRTLADDPASTSSLTRILSDGFAPLGDGTVLADALARYGAARTQVLEREPADRALLDAEDVGRARGLPEPALASWWQRANLFGVIVPTVDGDQLLQVASTDGTRFVPVFTTSERASEWESRMAEERPIASATLKLRDLAPLAAGAGAGLVFDMLDENVALGHSFLASRDTSEVIPAGTHISLGRPKDLPSGLPEALQAWGQSNASVSQIAVAQSATADGRLALLATVATDSPSGPDEWGSTLGRVIPKGIGLDLVPSESKLGRVIIDAGLTVYARG